VPVNSCLTLSSERVRLRRLSPGDASSLFDALATEPVGQFMLPPPDSPERFGRFISWARRQERDGRQFCFGIVPSGHEAPVGLIQVRRESGDATTAEWGFALSERFWGTGLFVASADVVLPFLFQEAGIVRLEARTIVENGRAIGALQKLQAVQEGRLRRGFRRAGEYYDQFLWSILADEWRPAPCSRRAA
jgi:ribosomal-protein-alanine N-acetyltransferase